MPEQGEQHKPAAAATNPFEDVKPRMSEYTAQEIATLSSRLEKQLGPEYISSRPGAGGNKVHYLAADKCINLANEVFGFNGWSSSIQNVQIDFVDESPNTGKVSLGLSVIVRVALRDGTFHEDIGYGHIENAKGKAAAFEKAKKEGTTDALKRALRNFGNLLGNCVYDKDYVARVTKLKIAPVKWDPDSLHRHPDFAPPPEDFAVGGVHMKTPGPANTDVMQARGFIGDPEDEFGSDDFDEADFSVPQGDHPDGVTLDFAISSERLRRRNSLPDKAHSLAKTVANEKSIQRPKSPLTRHYTGPALGHQRPNYGDLMNPKSEQNVMQGSPSTPSLDRPHQSSPSKRPVNSGSTEQQQPQLSKGPTDGPVPSLDTSSGPRIPESFSSSDHEPPAGFFTARAAESLQNSHGLAIKAPAFDPHLESPSIRKTAGVDHSKTKPVGRDVVGTAAAPLQQPMISNDLAKTPAEKIRRVGMPMGNASPLQNRGSYKLPQMKRPLDPGVPRSVLGDVTPASINLPSDASGDGKRQRT